MQIGILTFLLLVISTLTYGRTSWVRFNNGENTCEAACSREGLEAVLAPKGDATVCAIEHEGEAYPGTLPRDLQQTCRTRLTSEQIIVGKSADTHCLCADDGSNKGSDYAWISSKPNHAGCIDTCKETSPKYMYPVYGSFIQSWLQVCAASEGEIGFHESNKALLCSASKDAPQYGCLCTQMYAGDLDKSLDP